MISRIFDTLKFFGLLKKLDIQNNVILTFIIANCNRLEDPIAIHMGIFNASVRLIEPIKKLTQYTVNFVR